MRSHLICIGTALNPWMWRCRSLDVEWLLGSDCDTANFYFIRNTDLDFLGTIKLVNYIRSQVKQGNMSPDVSSKDKFDDELYLMPVLEDDALLYSLDDIDEEAPDAAGETDAERRVIELQEDLERLQTQFSEYRDAVQKSMEEQLSKEDEKLKTSPNAPIARRTTSKIEEADADYFVSYSYNGTVFEIQVSQYAISRLTK